MFLIATVTLALVFPQNPGGRLRLPPPKPAVQQPANEQPASPATELEKFRRDLVELRGVFRSRGPAAEMIVHRMGETYLNLSELILEMIKVAPPRELEVLMLVARRYGTEKHGEELLFQVLVRPLGTKTRVVMETMALLQGKGAKRALMECTRSRISGVRRTAVDMLEPLVGADDLPFALSLSSERNLDAKLSGVQLLAAMDDEAARKRLVSLLSKSATVAAAACRGLIGQGAAAVPALQRVLTQPPMDRAFAYAAFALASIEETSGAQLLREEDRQPLLRQLDALDPSTRGMAAVALARMAHRSPQSDPGYYRDAELVEALIGVVAPDRFVTNMSMIKGPAERQLVALTGRESRGGRLEWRGWWNTARDGFVGMRLSVDVDATNAGFAVIDFETFGPGIRLIGEGLAGAEMGPDRRELLLTADQVLELITALRNTGFMTPVVQSPAAALLPHTRSLELQVQGARARVSAPTEDRYFDRLAAVVDQCVDREKWQFYRRPDVEPDRAAFWRSERRWLDAHPDPKERNRRLLQRIVKTWPSLEAGAPRQMALEHLLEVPDKAELIEEADGLRFVELVLADDDFGEVQLGLLELALIAPGDRVWRQVLDVVQRLAGNSGRATTSRIFALLGPERVIASLGDERVVVLLASIDEVVQLRDMRAGAPLLELTGHESLDVRRSAVYALGKLPFVAARDSLIALVADNETEPVIRRECLQALGRIGGSGVFDVLRQALAAPNELDRQAAVKGLGELRDPLAARALAEVFVSYQNQALGELARFYLRQQGSVFAIPALRTQLSLPNPAVRNAIVLMLGSFQDPAVVPDLTMMLEGDSDPLQVVQLLEGTTGLDIGGMEDRINTVDAWYRAHRTEPQHQWLLDSLSAAGIATTLTAEQFSPAAELAAVPELARLLVEAPEGRVRVLAAAVLRQVAREDFGPVTPQTSPSALEAMAVRYRFLADAAKAASGK